MNFNFTLRRKNQKVLDALTENAYRKLEKKNVDLNGNYVKYSKLESRFDGLTCMFEGLTELEDGLIDLIQLVQDNKSKIAKKLSRGEFKITEDDKDTLFYDVSDINTYIEQWLSGYNSTIQRGHDDFFFTGQNEESEKELGNYNISNL